MILAPKERADWERFMTNPELIEERRGHPFVAKGRHNPRLVCIHGHDPRFCTMSHEEAE